MGSHNVLTHWMYLHNKYWPEDGLIKPKHVAKAMYYWLYIDVVFWWNKILYEYWITQQDGSSQQTYKALPYTVQSSLPICKSVYNTVQ
jgi:hypothetical protein